MQVRFRGSRSLQHGQWRVDDRATPKSMEKSNKGPTAKLDYKPNRHISVSPFSSQTWCKPNFFPPTFRNLFRYNVPLSVMHTEYRPIIDIRPLWAVILIKTVQYYIVFVYQPNYIVISVRAYVILRHF